MDDKQKKMDKASKVLTTTFKDACKDMSEDDLNAEVAKAMQRMRLLKEEMEADEKLMAAKAIVKDLNEAFSATRKYETARVDYLLGLLEVLQTENTGHLDNE
jgi:vacuolar-type H+-ATPase subunit I/STV1